MTQQLGGESIEGQLTTAQDSLSPSDHPVNVAQPHTLYKRRFVGLFGLFVLNLAAAMPMPWFGPIAKNVSVDFNISLDQVNWLGNCVSCAFLPSTLITVWIVSRYGVRRCCEVGSALMFLSAWIRYAATSRSLPTSGAYALLTLSQLISALPQASFQVLGPKYSESWFNLQGRTTATMTIAISNPIGSALGQLISPLAGTTRHSILILAIISTAALPCIFLIADKPPTAPTHAAEREPRPLPFILPNFASRRRRSTADEQVDDVITLREKVDFVLVFVTFSVFVGVAITFSVLSSQWLAPYGYSSVTAGLMGAALILSGIVAVVIAAPLLDRVFTTHLCLTIKVVVPIMAIGWLSLIWAVRQNNDGALFSILFVIGASGYIALITSLEMGVELTRAADSSSAMLWFGGNLFAIMFTLVEPALREDSTASPPYNMRKGLMLQGILGCVAAIPILFLKGEQKRRKRDELEQTAGAGLALQDKSQINTTVLQGKSTV